MKINDSIVITLLTPNRYNDGRRGSRHQFCPINGTNESMDTIIRCISYDCCAIKLI
jgi:hypothetical protein